VTTLEEDLAKGICDKTVQCYPALAKLAWGDAAGCVARVAPQFKKSLAAPGNQINATNAKACIDAFKLAACGTDPGELPACNIPGTLANGTACGADSQCASNSCYTVGTADCGTCQPRAAEGASCTAAKCAPGLICESETSKCVKPGGVGASCDGLIPCANGLDCVAGKCAKQLGGGAACQVDGAAKCDTAAGFFCKPAALGSPTGTCTAIGFNKPPAGKCGVDVATLTFNLCEASSCEGAAGATPGTCTPYLKDGDACGDGINAQCQSPALCRSGKCTIDDPGACK